MNMQHIMLKITQKLETEEIKIEVDTFSEIINEINL